MPPDITIEVDEDTGNFTYTPSVYHASPEDRITWWVPKGDWAIAFPGGTPLDTAEIHGRAAKRFPARVRRNAPKGFYHYVVAVAVGNKVFLDAGCPTIVIG